MNFFYLVAKLSRLKKTSDLPILLCSYCIQEFVSKELSECSFSPILLAAPKKTTDSTGGVNGGGDSREENVPFYERLYKRRDKVEVMFFCDSVFDFVLCDFLMQTFFLIFPTNNRKFNLSRLVGVCPCNYHGSRLNLLGQKLDNFIKDSC